MIEGRVFTIYTDHKPLTFAFLQKPEKCSPRQFRHLDFIAQFFTDIQYVPGSQNVVADALSRVDAIHATLDYKSLATSQQTDEELKVPLQGTDSGLHLKLLQMPESDVHIYCDVSTPTARPFISRPFRRTAFNSIHQLSHPGVNTTVKLIKERYVWPSISKDCRTWTRSCMDCQRAKVTRHVHAPLGSFSPPTRRFEHVHLDMIIMPHSDGFRYCLTMVDRFTRWPEVIPLAAQEAPLSPRPSTLIGLPGSKHLSVSQQTKAVNSSPPYSRNSAHSPAPTISAPRLTTLQPMEWSSDFIDSSRPQSSATTQTAGPTFSPLYYSASEQPGEMISRHPVQNLSMVNHSDSPVNSSHPRPTVLTQTPPLSLSRTSATTCDSSNQSMARSTEANTTSSSRISMLQTESSCAATSPSVAFRCHKMTVPPTKSSIAAQGHSSSISMLNTPLSLLIDSSQHTP
ncbi:hypothetical protein M8J77_012169 [Diaphorina citri]|nr:hypothetical protein M8J77_012169 [Diaphorina citri]